MSGTQSQHLEQWSRWHAGLMLGGSALSIYIQRPLPLVILFLISFTWLFSTQKNNWKNRFFLGGPANWVTWFRLIILTILMSMSAWLTDWQLSLLAGFILALDGLDGLLARKFQTQSFFGEYFDKESDAVFVLSICLLIYLEGLTGSWVLIMGWLRYIYVLLLIGFKPKDKKESRSKLGQAIAVLLMGSLVLSFMVPQPAIAYWLGIVVAIVCLSFMHSFSTMIVRS